MSEKSTRGEQKISSQTKQGPEAGTGYEHYKAFYELLPTDPEAARAELTTFSALAFHGHPLTKEWEELFFRISREKEGTIPEVTRLFELKKQMLEDHSSEKHAKEIKSLETAIRNLESISQLFKARGTLDTKKYPSIQPLLNNALILTNMKGETHEFSKFEDSLRNRHPNHLGLCRDFCLCSMGFETI